MKINKNKIIIILSIIIFLFLIITSGYLLKVFYWGKAEQYYNQGKIRGRGEGTISLLQDLCYDGYIDIRDENNTLLRQMTLSEVCEGEE